MGIGEIWSVGLLVIMGCMTLLWLWSLLLKDSSIIDVFWGPGFVVLAFIYNILAEDGFVLRKTLLTAMVTIWGVRLGGYILWRNWGHSEDFRYQQWRKAAGVQWWWRSFFKVFMLQGVLMVLISLPLLVAQYSDSPGRLTILDGVGVIVWGIGFIFEAGGDLQLARFKADPANKGKVLNRGFWKYTRHPNYFGDACQWWGFYLLALSAGGFWTILSPIIMTGLLMRVSGVALLEKTLVETKPQYRDYIERTSPFFPHPPRQRRTV